MRFALLTASYRAYGSGLLLGLLGVSLLWFGLFQLQLGISLPAAAWMADAYAIKHARAAARPSPKILLLGGSSTLFSLDSRQLERAWQRPVVNLGANVALGLDYILRSAEPHLNPGDLIIAPLEYNLYQDDGVPSDQLLDYIVGQDPAYYHRLPLFERFEVIARLPAARLLAGLAARGQPPQSYSGLYAAQHIDSDGNYRANNPGLHDPQTQAGIKRSLAAAQAKQHRYGHQDRANSHGWRRLRRYQRALKARGICLLLIPPAIMFQPSYRADPIEAAFYRKLPERARARGLTYLGEPLAFMYPSASFFDTLYHLNADARTSHTRAVIQLLGPQPQQWCP